MVATALTPIQKMGAEDAFREVEGLIIKLVADYQKKYGGDWDETFSRALQGFMRAFRTFDPSKSKFTTWICWVVWCDILKREPGLPGTVKMSQLDTTTNAGAFGSPDDPVCKIITEALSTKDEIGLDDISTDAEIVLQAALAIPEEMRRSILNGNSPKKARTWLTEQFSQMGWTAARITEAFEEVGGALV